MYVGGITLVALRTAEGGVGMRNASTSVREMFNMGIVAKLVFFIDKMKNEVYMKGWKSHTCLVAN